MHESIAPPNRRLVRQSVAATYLGISRTTLWRQLQAGVWPAPIDVAGIPMLDLAEIDARIAELKATRDAEARDGTGG